MNKIYFWAETNSNKSGKEMEHNGLKIDFVAWKNSNIIIHF